MDSTLDQMATGYAYQKSLAKVATEENAKLAEQVKRSREELLRLYAVNPEQWLAVTDDVRAMLTPLPADHPVVAMLKNQQTEKNEQIVLLSQASEPFVGRVIPPAEQDQTN